ncbi:flagellar hook-associated protein 1 FlgK [Litoreibacter ponti]|uniref:Flagellar hook-associated protein 1 n=1 Tax=Litoreibacter ponti TaxID=1510457 RepID=A0A2T6BNE0_9RHOB|nr:flagellar hook-associated protein FlgK [Litoreibacter ponti]PTX57600.1 flagellar hook-associated protein 1 FlgK [Litoreibacter ponti]
MSISSALSNAVSGLGAVSRSAELVSSNVANAMTEGYGRREIQLGSSQTGTRGSGVRVLGIERMVNQAALSDRRLADAGASYSQSMASVHQVMERVIGTPEDEASLSAHIDRFNQSLITAAANPSSEPRLASVLESSKALAAKFNSASDEVSRQRESADKSIGNMVASLNEALSDVDRLNDEIRRQIFTTGDASGLMDQRQIVIDQIARIIPISEVARDDGQVALVTPNGTTLVDADAAQFTFSVTPVITPDMTLASGALSGLTLTGAASQSGTALDAISGGSLAAKFEIRDTELPRVQDDLDALAADLIDRAAVADPSLSAGVPGLFTNSQSLAGSPYVEGLASRLQVNAAVDPSQGGALWRIRDGVEAGASGASDDNTRLSALVDAMAASRQPVGGAFSDAGSASALASDLASKTGQARFLAEQRQGFEASKVQAFSEALQGFGVDTDQEMQKLLLIEQNYAANAKVIQTIDDMLQSLLRI